MVPRGVPTQVSWLNIVKLVSHWPDAVVPMWCIGQRLNTATYRLWSYLENSALVLAQNPKRPGIDTSSLTSSLNVLNSHNSREACPRTGIGRTL